MHSPSSQGSSFVSRCTERIVLPLWFILALCFVFKAPLARLLASFHPIHKVISKAIHSSAISETIEELIKGGFIALSTAIFCAVLFLFLKKKLEKRSQRFAWIGLTLSVPLLLNLFLLITSQSLLFWLVLYPFTPDRDLTLHALKEALPFPHDANPSLIVMGSSQSASAIDEWALQKDLGKHAALCEIHFPGSQPSDWLYNAPHFLSKKKPSALLIFTSPRDYLITPKALSLYSIERGNPLLAFRFAKKMPHFQGLSSLLTRSALRGLFPLYGYGISFQKRLLGQAPFTLQQAAHDSGLKKDAHARVMAIPIAPKKILRKRMDFELKAIDELSALCQEKNIDLIICWGNMHPLLTQRCPSAYIEEIKTRLIAIAKRRSQTFFLSSQQGLEAPLEKDFSDPLHFVKDFQRRYTKTLGKQLNVLWKP